MNQTGRHWTDILVDSFRALRFTGLINREELRQRRRKLAGANATLCKCFLCQGPGDVVWFPPGLRHWHGATPTVAMTHIAIQESLDGKNVAWLEHVSDEQYRK